MTGQSDVLRLASVGSGKTDDDVVILWVATPSGRTRRVLLNRKESLALIRQLASILEGGAS